ncbi:serine/threonine protein phosphatase [Halobacillus salinarum]|uniref:Serine/threonine protein phosphatase n=1 Tax=Halobacillus salinarum TaxID=2932257 RepID=A0ABY4ENB7_9BACI|nr:metallophosphoesterase family protein [Halobacillus salinarum]UOQ45951.1 serine/threonine protein phosphatase [Halobacillus salinarum]
MRYLAVSDIHGEVGKLEKVLSEASYDPKRDQLILLGDYVDRGPYSRNVVAKIQALVEMDGAIAIKGNHDDLFIRSQYDSYALELWEINGASSTLKSYEGNYDEMRNHQKWLENNLKLYYETEDYIFVHAGLEPEVPVEKQEEETMLWTRHTAEIGLGKTVIHGHTPVETIAYYHDQVDIDTGAAYGGKLTALELPNHEVYAV